MFSKIANVFFIVHHTLEYIIGMTTTLLALSTNMLSKSTAAGTLMRLFHLSLKVEPLTYNILRSLVLSILFLSADSTSDLDSARLV